MHWRVRLWGVTWVDDKDLPRDLEVCLTADSEVMAIDIAKHKASYTFATAIHSVTTTQAEIIPDLRVSLRRDDLD